MRAKLSVILRVTKFSPRRGDSWLKRMPLLGAPIIPLFILADPPVLKKGDKWYDMPERVPVFEVELLEPIVTTRGGDSKALTEQIRAELAERLEAARLRAVERHRANG